MNWFNILRKKDSGNIAKDRLKLLLISERTSCSPDTMEMIRNDIIRVISKYMDIDCEHIEIQIHTEECDGTIPTLFANIPIKEVRTNND